MRRTPFVSLLGLLLVLTLNVPTAMAQAAQDVTIEKGTVVQRVGNTIIVRHDTGEVKKYTVPGDAKVKFAEGEKTVYDLRPGDVLTRITIRATATASMTEAELKTLPPATTAAAPAAAPAAKAAPAPAAAKPAMEPVPAAAAAPAAAPAKLPKTAGPLPLVGLAGLLCLAGGLALRRRR